MYTRHLKLYVISIICFILDLFSKFVIVNTLDYEEELTVIKNFFSIFYIRNTGAAFGMFSSHTVLLTIITLLIIYVFIKHVNKNKFNTLEEVSYGLIFGGAVGNLFDRIINGYVIDFFSFNIFGYSFPVFNVADICVVIGVFLLIIINFGGLYGKDKTR